MKNSELKPFGSGSLYWDKTNSRWVWEGGLLINGLIKHKKIYGKTSALVIKKLKDTVNNINRGIELSKDITVEKWINIWLNEFKKNEIRPSTRRIYEGHLNKIVKKFGKKKLKELTAIELQRYFNQLKINGHFKGGGLSAASINHMRKYFGMVYDDAIKNKLIEYNPVRATKPVHGGQVRETISLTDEETIRFINTVKNGDYVYETLDNPHFRKNGLPTQYIIKQNYILILLAFSTGMRISEITGLTWDCINLQMGYIVINKQLARNKGESTFGEIFCEPKSTNSKRNIAVSVALLNKLMDFFNFQREFALTMGDYYQNKYNLVFTNTNGTPFNYHNFIRRYFSRMVKAAGISKTFTFHCIRHTHCSLLLEHNADVKAASLRLGHSDPSFTRKVYQEVLPSMERSLATMWDKVILDKIDKTEANNDADE